MTAMADPAEEPIRKKSKIPLILGLVLAIAGGAGGFLATRMGLIGGGESAAPAPVPATPGVPALGPIAYVAIDPLLVNLPRASGRQFLRFTSSLEVDPAYQTEVNALKPRILDVMNSYLRAVEPADFEDQMFLTELRAQLLRRIQVVTGEGRVRDLLVIEFVLN